MHKFFPFFVWASGETAASVLVGCLHSSSTTIHGERSAIFVPLCQRQKKYWKPILTAKRRGSLTKPPRRPPSKALPARDFCLADGLGLKVCRAAATTSACPCWWRAGKGRVVGPDPEARRRRHPRLGHRRRGDAQLLPYRPL